LTSLSRAPTTFKLEGEVTSLSKSSQGEVGDNREKWGDFWEKSVIWVVTCWTPGVKKCILTMFLNISCSILMGY
jgi:hypothetical protein